MTVKTNDNLMNRLLFSLFLIFASLQSYACMCPDSTSFADLWLENEKDGNSVFVGRVIDHRIDTNIVTIKGHPLVWTTFEVWRDHAFVPEESWDCNKRTIRQSWSSCDEHFLVDSVYVVFYWLDRSREFYQTSGCSPTRLYSSLSATDRLLMGPGQATPGNCMFRDNYWPRHGKKEFPVQTDTPEPAPRPKWVLLLLFPAFSLLLLIFFRLGRS